MRRMTVPISCLSAANDTLVLQSIPWHFAHLSPTFSVLSDSHQPTSWQHCYQIIDKYAWLKPGRNQERIVMLQVTAMFSRLKLTFESRIKSLSWLDEATRQEALFKLASLRGQFLTWPQLWNQTYVASLLQDVSCHALYMWHYACFSHVPYFSLE